MQRYARRFRQRSSARRSKGMAGDGLLQRRASDRGYRMRLADRLRAPRRSALWRAQCWPCSRHWRAIRNGGCDGTLSRFSHRPGREARALLAQMANISLQPGTERPYASGASETKRKSRPLSEHPISATWRSARAASTSPRYRKEAISGSGCCATRILPPKHVLA